MLATDARGYLPARLFVLALLFAARLLGAAFFALLATFFLGAAFFAFLVTFFLGAAFFAFLVTFFLGAAFFVARVFRVTVFFREVFLPAAFGGAAAFFGLTRLPP